MKIICVDGLIELNQSKLPHCSVTIEHTPIAMYIHRACDVMHGFKVHQSAAHFLGKKALS